MRRHAALTLICSCCDGLYSLGGCIGESLIFTGFIGESLIFTKSSTFRNSKLKTCSMPTKPNDKVKMDNCLQII